MTLISPEKKLERLQDQLGLENGKRFHSLCNDWFHLSIIWDEFNYLFLGPSKRLDLLDRTGQNFFETLYFQYFQSITLALSRLTDPVVTGETDFRWPRKLCNAITSLNWCRVEKNLPFNRANSTVQFLPSMIAERRPKKDLNKLINDMNSRCKFARKFRNKKFGHSDLGEKLNPSAKFTTVEIEEVAQAIRSIYDVLDYFSLHMLNESIGDPTANRGIRSVEQLIYILWLGQDRLDTHLNNEDFEPIVKPHWLTDPKRKKAPRK